MGHDVLALAGRHLRGTDSNTLLRFYDQAKDLFTNSPLQQERTRADLVLRRLARELTKRKISF